MTAIISLLVILAISITVTRIATIALVHTGLSHASARFQARSAFTGVGFTTDEAENVTRHPVRRKIVMLLMLTGNVGIVSALASLLLAFLRQGGESGWPLKLATLFAGLAAIIIISNSAWVDRWLGVVISRLLSRLTDLDVRDYTRLLRLSGDYQIMDLYIKPDDWIAGKQLHHARLRDEGMLVLGIYRADGHYLGVPNGSTEIKEGDKLVLYGRQEQFEELDRRGTGIGGELAHQEAVARQQRVKQAEHQKDAEKLRQDGDPEQPGQESARD